LVGLGVFFSGKKLKKKGGRRALSPTPLCRGFNTPADGLSLHPCDRLFQKPADTHRLGSSLDSSLILIRRVGLDFLRDSKSFTAADTLSPDDHCLFPRFVQGRLGVWGRWGPDGLPSLGKTEAPRCHVKKSPRIMSSSSESLRS
jgi:hypothetical protein